MIGDFLNEMWEVGYTFVGDIGDICRGVGDDIKEVSRDLFYDIFSRHSPVPCRFTALFVAASIVVALMTVVVVFFIKMQ